MINMKNTSDYFNKMFQNYEAIILLIDKDNKDIVAWNFAAEKFYGYSADELKHLKISNINTLSDDEISAEMAKAFANKKNYFEFKHRKKNGVIVDVSAQSSSIALEGKTYLFSIINDISKRIEYEDGLRKQKEWSDSIFQSVQSGIMIIERESHTIIDINEAGLKMIGGTKEEVVGKLCYNFVCPAQKNCCPITDLYKKVINEEKILFTLSKDEIPIIKSVTETQFDNKEYLIESFIDIRYRKNVEKKFQESEKLYRSLVENIDEIIYSLDTEGVFTYVSPVWTKLLGHNTADVVGKSFSVFVHPDDLPNCYEFINNALLTKAFTKNEIEYKTKHLNGEWRLHRTKASISYDANGNVIGFVGMAKDITELKKIKASLRESEERWKFAIDGSGDGLWDWNIEANTVYYSPMWKSMLGYSEDDISNKLNEWENRIHPEDLAKCKETLNDHFINKLPYYKNEHRALCKDGTFKWILDRGKVVEWSQDGNPKRVIGTHRDITEEKYFQAQIKKSEEKLRTIIHTSPDAISTASLDGVVQTVNPQAISMWGYEYEQELIGRRVIEFIHSSYHEQAKYFINELLAGKITGIAEYLMIKKDGTTFFAEANANIIKNDNNEPISILFVIRDITERRKANQSLKESEEKFRMLFKYSPVGMAMVDHLTGEYLEVNDAVLRPSGYTKEEFTNLNYWGITPVEYKAQELEQFESLNKNGRFGPHEKEYIRKDGGRIPILISGFLLFDANGRELEWRIIEDITERKRANQALKESEENFRNFFNTIDDIIIIESPDGNILYSNNSMEKKLGYSSDDLKTMHILDLYPNEYRNDAEKFFADMFMGIKDSCPLPIENKNKARIPVETRVWFGKWNGQDSVFGIIKDLSSQTAILDKYNKLFDNNPALMAVSSVPDSKFTEVNTAFLETLGYTRDEVIGKTDIELNLFIQPENQEGISKLLLNYRKIKNIELKARAKNDKIIDGIFSGELIDNQIEKSFLTVMVDITDRKNNEIKINNLLEEVMLAKNLLEVAIHQKDALIEELTETKNKLEITNATKDKFFSIIAHDLKSPFSGFLGFTKILSEEIFDMSMREVQELSTTLRNSADQLYKLLENLLEWSRMQRGITNFAPDNFPLHTLVKQNIDIIKSKLELKDLNIDNKVQPEITVNADIQMLNGTLRNLISNAVKFTPKGGKILIDAYEENEMIVTRIKDNGIGMDSNMISKLFIVGEKTSRTGTEGETSTGLGLILCKEFVERHGGKIWVLSEVGKGSTFFFSLPKASKK